MSIQSLLLINVLLACVWVLFAGSKNPANFFVGVIIGFIVLSVYSREYGRRIRSAVAFFFYVIWQIALSSIAVSKAILRPARHVRPGVVAIPLEASSAFEILLLATVITLTPGTISVETGSAARKADADGTAAPDAAPGRRVLFVHALTIDDPEALRTSIKQDFERRILSFTRPSPSAPRQEAAT